MQLGHDGPSASPIDRREERERCVGSVRGLGSSYIHMHMCTPLSCFPGRWPAGQYHDSFGWVSDGVAVPHETLTGDPGQGGGIELVVRERAPGHVPSKTDPLERSLEGGRAPLLPENAQNILRASRVPFLDLEPSTPQDGGEPHPAFGQHPHRSQGQGKEADPHTPKFPVTLSEVGAGAVVNGAPTPRKGQGGIDQGQLRLGAIDHSEDFVIRVEYRGASIMEPWKDAATRVTSLRPSQIEANDRRVASSRGHDAAERDGRL